MVSEYWTNCLVFRLLVMVHYSSHGLNYWLFNLIFRWWSEYWTKKSVILIMALIINHYQASKYWTTNSLLLSYFCYSEFHYSDAHCNQNNHLKWKLAHRHLKFVDWQFRIGNYNVIQSRFENRTFCTSDVKCPVFKCHLNTGPFTIRPYLDHLNTRHVRYSDPHCI